jgi:hypothetical protein
LRKNVLPAEVCTKRQRHQVGPKTELNPA